MVRIMATAVILVKHIEEEVAIASVVVLVVVKVVV